MLCIKTPRLFLAVFACFISIAADASMQCGQWAAKLVSVQGDIRIRRAGETAWTPVAADAEYCVGDALRVGPRSRAAVFLSTDATLRLDENTTVTFTDVERKETTLIEMVSGAIHFFSHWPRSIKVLTPFMNADVEGTEFFVKVDEQQTSTTVFEGIVTASNQAGNLRLTRNQSAVAKAESPPILRTAVNPRDAVNWALHYPLILDLSSEEIVKDVKPEEQNKVRESIKAYEKGDLPKAFSSLDAPHESIALGDAGFLVYRSQLLLSVGRVDEALEDIEIALRLDPQNHGATALKSIVATVQNNKEEALDLAKTAVAAAPDSSTALLALSYANQAHFDIESSLANLEEAVKLNPRNAPVWARLSEIRLSFGQHVLATEAAKQATLLSPNLARTQTVLGFANLSMTQIADAQKAFKKAIALDQADPLPRLGLGLAMIRSGALAKGREEIEIAAALDPGNSLIRSYLGKAYFEEKREDRAAHQYENAKELDPRDPTPWFYDAILKQTANRPAEALNSLEKSIELNDNRAVYRSRLLLDEDLAARSASQVRIYANLGFQHLALLEGRKSLSFDPTNHSAHRLLADSYSSLPRHEIARVSELLQSQLRQPINATPVQARLAETELLSLEGGGPGTLSFNEFNPMFLRDRLSLQATAMFGNNGMGADETTLFGAKKNYSLSLGQFHSETDGIHENSNLDFDVYNIFAQASLSPKTSIQLEYRRSARDQGQLALPFETDPFPAYRLEKKSDAARVGLRHSFTPASEIIGSFSYQWIEYSEMKEKDEEILVDIMPGLTISTLMTTQSRYERDRTGYIAEAQHSFKGQNTGLITGIGYTSQTAEEALVLGVKDDLPPPIEREEGVLNKKAYTYANIWPTEAITLTAGFAIEAFEFENINRKQFSPKLGLAWEMPIPRTTLRLAWFKTLKGIRNHTQTVEPTQIAGFNQFFDDHEGTDARRLGAGIDYRASPRAFYGVEYSRRDLEVPFRKEEDQDFAEWDENIGRAYAYWTPGSRLGIGMEYQFERMQVAPEVNRGIIDARTHSIPILLSYYSPSGFSFSLASTYYNQKGDFDTTDARKTTASGGDNFWVVDGKATYRLPKRLGILTVGASNLLNEEFEFQNTDLANPKLAPNRSLFARVTLAL